MSHREALDALWAGWEQGLFTRGEVVNKTVDLLTRDNIVEVIASLPPEWHQTMVDELVDAAKIQDTAQLIFLRGGIARWETESDPLKREAMKREYEQALEAERQRYISETLPAIKWWVKHHGPKR